MHSYRMHLQSDCNYAKDDNITFIVFEQWKIMYDADPSNWYIEEHTEFYEDNFFYDLLECMFDYYVEGKYYDIYYKYPNNKEKHYIKFLRRKDYRNFCKFYKELYKYGKDYENQQELLRLGEAISKESTKRLEEAQKKLDKAYMDNVKLIERISKN